MRVVEADRSFKKQRDDREAREKDAKEDTINFRKKQATGQQKQIRAKTQKMNECVLEVIICHSLANTKQ